MNSFDSFYQELYRHEHQNPINRWIHFLSNLAILACLTLAIARADWRFLPAAAFFQFVPPFFGHVLFEGVHEATSVSPLWAALGNWRMFGDILRGRERI